jgi:hypothetical protein
MPGSAGKRSPSTMTIIVFHDGRPTAISGNETKNPIAAEEETNQELFSLCFFRK